ncbi:MAG: helix-turn-helix domain-containing protein [Gemmataceae bacterium]
MDKQKLFYTLSDTAALFDVSLATVKRWVQAGRLDVRKFGGCSRITADSIRTYANLNTKKED